MKRRVILIVSVLAVVVVLGGLTHWYLRRNASWRLLERVDLAIRANQFDKAASLAGDYIAKYPQDWRGYYQFAKASARQGRYDQARVELRKVLDAPEHMNADEVMVGMLLSDTYAHPARLKLSTMGAARMTDEEIRQAMISPLEEAARILGGLSSSLPEQTLDIQASRGRVLRDLSTAFGYLAREWQRAAVTAQDARNSAALAEATAKYTDAQTHARRSIEEASSILLDVVRKDPTRTAVARDLVEMVDAYARQYRDAGLLMDVSRVILSPSLADPPPEAAAMLILATQPAGKMVRTPSALASLKDAASAMDGILARHPNEIPVKLLRAEVAWRLSDYGTAQRICDEVLAQDKGNGQARLMHAQLMARAGNLAGAETELYVLRRDFPRWPEPTFDYGMILQAGGKREAARQVMRDLVRGIQPNHAQARRFLAESLMEDNFPDQAFEDAKAFYESTPDDPVAIALLVKVAKATDQSDLARTTLSKAVTENADRPDVLAAAAEGYVILGDQAEATKTLDRLANVKVTSTEGQLALARTLVGLNQMARAEAMLNELAEKHPGLAGVNYELGRLYALQGKPMEALAQYRLAVNADARNEVYRLALAGALFDAGELDECQDVLDVADASNAAANLLRLRVQLMRGTPAESGQIIQEMVKAGLSGPVAAMVCLTNGQPQQCIEIVQLELAKKPPVDEGNLRSLMGQAYAMLGDRDKAIEQFKQALSLSPGQLPIYRRLADLMSGSGDGSVADVDRVAGELAQVKGARSHLVELTKGALLSARGNHTQAVATYLALADQKSVSPATRKAARFQAALELALAGEPDEAIRQLDSLADDPQFSANAMVAKVQLLLQLQRGPEAMVMLNRLRQDALKAGNSQLLRTVANLYAQAGRYPETLAICDQLISMRPNDSWPLELKGAMLTSAGKPEEAVPVYETAIQRRPGGMQSYLALAHLLDGLNRPTDTMNVLDRMSTLGETARLRAQLERGIILTGWGLQEPAVACFEELARGGYSKSSSVQMMLGRALLMLGQESRAKTLLEAIPTQAQEYLLARRLLAQMAKSLDAKLAVLNDLEKAMPGRIEVLNTQMDVLLDDDHPAEAVAAFQRFASGQPGDRPLPQEQSVQALKAMLQIGDVAAAERLALRMHEQTKHPRWTKAAILLMLGRSPKDAQALLVPQDKAGFDDAMLGLCVALACNDNDAVQRWSARIAQMDSAGDAGSLGRGGPAAWRFLSALALGKADQAQAELDKAKLVEPSYRKAAAELIAHVRANGTGEAAKLLEASMAADLGLTSLAFTRATDILKARPECLWAAALAVRLRWDADARKTVLAALKPDDCALAFVLRAANAVDAKDFAKAAELYGQAANAQADDYEILLNKAMALENADLLLEANTIYRRVWREGKIPLGANNAAYLTAMLNRNDPAKLAEAAALAEEAVKMVPFAPDYRDTLGWIAFLRGQKDQACLELRRSIKSLPDSPDVHYHLGLAEQALGNADLARWHLSAAVRLAEQLRGEGKNTPASDNAMKEATEALKALQQTKT